MGGGGLRRVRARAPASTSNLGSGFDTVGLALDRDLRAEYVPGPGPLSLVRGGTLAGLPGGVEDDVLAAAFLQELVRREFGDAGGELRVASDIPVAVGLGSSAAAVVAGLALAAAAAGDRPTPGDLLGRALELEGHPDNAAAAIHGGAVAVARDLDGRPVPVPLQVSTDVGFAFAAPGTAVATREARAALPREVPHDLAARGLGRLASLLAGLGEGDGDLLRVGFADELHVPYRLPLIPGAAAAVAAAEGAGAWAATVSGAGSGLIAVGPPERARAIAEAMAAAFAASGGGPGSIGFPVRPEPRGVEVELA